MTYNTSEVSVEGGQPVELYKFTIGATVFRYTSAEDSVTPTFDPTPYFSRQIDRNNPPQTNDDRRQPLEVTLPSDDALSLEFINIPPGQEVNLQVIRYHRADDTDDYIIWQGKITGASYTQDAILCTLSGVTDEGAFSRPIPRFKFQGLCNHVLYDTACTVTRASFKYTAVVSAVTAGSITVPGIDAAKGTGWAIGGYIDVGSINYRLVIAQSGDVLTLMVPFEVSPLGSSVDVFAGCDHTINVCETKFSNSANYGGFPYVPTFNPFQRGL